MTSWRWVAGLLAVLLLATACGSDPQEGVEDAAPAADDGVEGDGDGVGAGAVLGVLDPGVDVADEPDDPAAATFRAGQDGESLVVADVVRTDVSGFAEVVWFDGALARVDADSRYVLTELDATPGSAVVETRLEVGRVWNRLREDVVERYEVTTDVATAAVRGTAFWVACVAGGPCTFVVLEGTVLVTAGDGTQLELEAGQQVTVDADGVPGEVVVAERDDPWVVTNDGLDGDAGFDPLPAPEGPDDGGGLAAGDTTCPFVALPDGWSVADGPAPDAEPGAAEFCRLVTDGDGPFVAVTWSGAAGDRSDARIATARATYDETARREQDNCGGDVSQEFTEFDEAVGAGTLRGFSWRIHGLSCPNTYNNAFHGLVVDGSEFELELATAPYTGCPPVAIDAPRAELEERADCLLQLKQQFEAEYRRLAAVLLGGEGEPEVTLSG